MNISGCVVCVMLMGVTSSWGTEPGDSQHASPAEMIKIRIANFHKIGEAFKGIRDQLRRSDPVIPEIQEFAGRIESLGSQIPTWFPPGTDARAQDGNGTPRRISSGDPGKDDGKTRAKDEIWSQRSAFEDAHRRFVSEAQKMNEVAKTGDGAALAKQYQLLGKACKNCHNTFRE